MKEEFAAVGDFLGSQLALRVKDDWVLNRVSAGVPFLGFPVLPYRILLGRTSRQRFTAKFRRFMFFYQQDVWDEERMSRHLTPLTEFVKAADSFTFRRNIVERYGALP